MGLAKLAVKRPVTILMVTLIVVLLGLVSLNRLPIDLLPNIEVPVAIVMTNYSDTGPQEIENLITRPIEESLATVGNVKNISSVSSEGSSIVIAEFNFGTDMEFASLEMREKVDMIKGFLPDGASNPMVMKIDPNAMPILTTSLAGNGGELSNLQSFAEDIVKPRLERLDGVASADITGGSQHEVEVLVDQQKLAGYNLTLSYLANILRAENINLPGGEVSKGSQKLFVRTLGEFQSVEEIASLPIPLTRGGTVRLSDVANVSLRLRDESSIARINGHRSIDVSVQKESQTNTVQVAGLVKEELENIKQQYPQYNVEVIIDQSEFIEWSVNNVVRNLLLGGLFAVLVLYIFFRNLGTTFIVGLSIPISIITTFILLYFSGVTLNLMTLGGLALGVGMLVDNAIVVLENIYRFRQEGYSRKDAAVAGAGEVAMAVGASTLTTVAVFLPIIYVEGITSTIFKELAMTVTLALVTSLGVSLTLIPMLSSKLLRTEAGASENKRKSRLFDKVFAGFDRFFSGLERLYVRVLKWGLAHRKSTVVIGVLVFVVGITSLLGVGAEFLPSMDEGQLAITLTLPVGSQLEDTNEIATEVEGRLAEIEEVDIVFTQVAAGGQFAIDGGAANRATVSVLLKPLGERSRTTAEIANQVRDMIRNIPGAEKEVALSSNMMMMGGMGRPISISIKGDDLETLKEIGTELKALVEEIEGTREVSASMEEGIPEVQLNIDRLVASQYGLNAATIANSVKSTLDGTVATRYKYRGDEIDVMVRGDTRFGESLSNLEQLLIDTPSGTRVPLDQVASLSIELGPVAINRDAQSRVITVSGDIYGRDLGSVSSDIEKRLVDYQMPRGYTYEMGGENKEMNDALSDLTLALGLSVLLVYMILASQFESLLHPLTIMFAVPLSFAGGALGLFVTGRALSVPSMIGFIVLAGIVVNNAIVLIDYINRRRNSGEERSEAILNAGPIRLRPILMTTLTTVLGLLPVAVAQGEGSEMMSPMGIAVIFGLLLSTVLTLVFIPVMYSLLDDLAARVKRRVSA